MVGIPPQQGYELIEGRFLLGITNGHNMSYESGLTAHAGGTQAAGLLIPADIAFVEFDTVASGGDSAVLPFASQPGTVIVVLNSTATSMNVYSNHGTNPVTGAADKLNGSTSAAVAVAGTGGLTAAVRFYCPKAGVWLAS